MDLRGIDVTYPRVLVVGLVLVTVLAGGYAASTSTASFGSYNPGWDGGSELRGLATSQGPVTVAQDTTAYANEEVAAANTTAFVLAPADPYTDASLERIRGFVADGGTLVVAADFGGHGNSLLAGLGASSRIDGRLVRDEQYYYRSPDLPVARNVDAPLNETVEGLTLNHGSVVDPGANASVLVATSGYAYLDENRNGALDASETLGTYPVVVAEPLGEGRVVVVSDPSVFINTMLERPDNRAFARSLVTANDRVLLDYSHTGDVPLLAAVVLALRDSPLLQFFLGSGMLALGWLALRRNPLEWVERDDSVPAGTLSVSEIERVLRDAHPEWSAERVERVARSIGASKKGSVDD